MLGANISDRFCTTSGVCQGGVLAPALFCCAIDWILDNMICLRGVAVGNGKFTDLNYAGDIVLPANTHAELDPCLTDFSMSARNMGLNVSWKKTKVQCLGRAVPTFDLHVQSQFFESVDHFCYLGSVQDSNRRSAPDIRRRLGVATSSTSAHSRVWSQKKQSLNGKLRIYQTCILPIVYIKKIYYIVIY